MNASTLRAVAADLDAWSLFGDDRTADELSAAAHDARVRADGLEGALPLGVAI